MDHTMLARIMSLVAEMESLKIEVEVIKSEYAEDTTGANAHLLQEKADQIAGIAHALSDII